MLDKNTSQDLKKIIFQFLDPRKYKVFIFGSRAVGGERKFSDIDIGIEGKHSLDNYMISQLKEAFEESNIPYTVDIVDFSDITDQFRNVVGKHKLYLN